MKQFGSITNTLQDFEKRIEKIRKEVINDPDVKQFLEAHRAELTNAMIDEDLNVLQEYKDQQKHYDGHKFADYPNFIKGYVPELHVDSNRIKIHYLQCPCRTKYDRERSETELITSHHIQRDILNAKLKDIYMNHRDRLDVAMAVDDICTAITNGEQVKGLYLHGPFGTGKSFILDATANQLKPRKVRSTTIYLPEFIRTLKGSFKDGSFEKKLHRVRETNILMLDDIRAEEVTLWVRDEVIGSLLHYRMAHELPTLFSSNFDYSESEHHLAMTRDGGEKTKAVCIIERVKSLSTPYSLSGENFGSNWILK